MTNIPEMIFVKTEPLTLKSNSPGERLQDKRFQIQTDLREVKAQVEETDKKKIQQENVISEQDELTRKVSQGRRKIHDLQNKRKQIEIELTACKEDVFRLNSIIDDKSEERQEAVRALATIADITKDLRCRKRKLEEMLSLTQKDHILLRHISDRGIREIARHFGYSKAQYDGQDTFQCRALNNMAEGLETAEDLKAVSNMVHQINHDIEEQAPEKLIVEIEDEQGSGKLFIAVLVSAIDDQSRCLSS